MGHLQIITDEITMINVDTIFWKETFGYTK